MPHPISHISSVSPPQSLHSATDSPVSSASPEPSVLGSQEPHLASTQPPQIPDSALPTASVIDAEDPPAERLTSSTTDSEAQANKKKTHKKSNRYANQPKAKAHIGACVVGGITLGILAGPIGLVFAAAYINAMCGAMYGGSEYFTGDKTKHPKTEPEPQPENTPPRHRPNPNSVPSEEGRGPDESDTEQGKRHGGESNVTIGSNNFIFSPTNIFAPTIITSPTTTEGNVYFFREEEKNHKPTTGQKTSSTASQTDNSEQGSSDPDVKIVELNVYNRAASTGTDTDTDTGTVRSEVEKFLDTLDTLDTDEVVHAKFNDGMHVLIHSSKLSINLNKQSRKPNTTGEMDNSEIQRPQPSLHHRGKNFDTLVNAQIAHSQNSARLVANDETPMIGKNGTHSWQLQQQGSWELKSIDSVNAKTVQLQGFDRADPNNVQTSSGSAFERLDMELKKRHPQPRETTEQRIIDKLEVVKPSFENVKREQQYSKPLATKELTVVETSSSQWTKEITENGQYRWVNPKQSSDNDRVLLTAGAVSGQGQNYTQGIRNNLKPLDELKMAHFQQLKKNIKNNNEATRQSVLRSAGLVMAAPTVSEARLIRA
ncbi:TPA: hypothetical protein PMB70_003084 [Vibrio cholerae]|nr:hypothetical protein [Vibrio cholerae]